MIRASCEVWLDGQHYASTPADAVARRPVVLAPLSVEWGRSTATDQPDTGTASFSVRVWDPPDDLLALVHVGTTVEVWAAAHIPDAGGEQGPNIYPDPTFQSPPTLEGAAAWANWVPGVVTVNPAAAGASVWAAPAPYTDTPSGWDDIPAAYAGDRWQLSLTVTAPAGVPWSPTVTGWTAPTAAARVPVPTDIPSAGYVGTGAPQAVVVPFTVGELAAPVWLGAGIRFGVDFGRWSDAIGTWSEAVGTWSGVASTVGWSAVGLAPPAAAVRRVLVHSGRVSDLAWSAVSDDAVDIGLIATDITGPLGNRPIGDEPWPVQTLATRAARVVELAGIPVDLRIDPGVAGVQLSGRDVDSQESLGLLRDMAQSAGGVLWPATHATTGPYLWVEDPATRASVRVFVLDPDSGLIVIDNPRDPGGGLAIISACDLLRDPVSWRQAVGDVTTLVDVTWLEQTLDDDGLLAPTERHVTMTADAATLDRFGVNRVSMSTELVSAADATDRAAGLLGATSRLTWRVDGITYDTGLVDADIDSLDPATRLRTLLDLLDGTRRIGLGLTLIDLPAYAPIPGDTAGTYVEGGTYTYENDAWSLALKLSPTPSAGVSARWSDMPAGWSWSEMSPGISWADAAGTGVA
jgi:hypothetical protein